MSETGIDDFSLSGIGDVKADMMCKWLHQHQLEKMWAKGGADEGAIVRNDRNEYFCCPEGLRYRRGGIFDTVKQLKFRSAITVNTRVVELLLQAEDISFIPLENGLRLQIVPNVTHLARCQRHHFAAFIKSTKTLVVWDDQAGNLLERAHNIEKEVVSMVWNGGGDWQMMSRSWKEDAGSKQGVQDDGMMYTLDPEGGRMSAPPRRPVLIQPVITAITLTLLIAAMGNGWRQIAVEIRVDRNWSRLMLLTVMPLQCWLALFGMQTIAGCVVQLLGPLNQMTTNSKYYSGQAPPRTCQTTLPHVTIQCPLYKENLWSVIDPNLKSLRAAISTYEMQGGSANIFVNDDGMQVISAENARDRRVYYAENDIGWVARPQHNPKPANGEQGFVRAGKFKKASNMNYALGVSVRVEDQMARMPSMDEKAGPSTQDLYNIALDQVITEDNGQTWAEGNVQIGDFILLVDADTRIPTDCILDAVTEMSMSPEVAIIQFSSGVLNVTTSWFERGVTFFTNFVYTAIQFAGSNGDVTPFVGHNACLRWSAVQEVAYEEDAMSKYWSETTVSEDFDMALRLQTSGYTLRFATYTGQDFKEGVSLTVYDELARWEKYAYGCCELIFHPLAQWPFKGPFTPLFRKFVLSPIPVSSKLTILAYVGTYFAIGSAWVLTLLNYCLMGWFNGHLDHYYVDSFKIYCTMIVVFSALGNVALAVLRYRMAERSLLGALWENLTWIPLLTIFLGGISLHVSQAILAHLLGMNMSWGATSKEATETTFFREIPFILRKFRVTFAWCFALTCALLVLGGVGPIGRLVPYDWQMKLFAAIWPLATIVVCHFLLPLVLNPGLMQFTF